MAIRNDFSIDWEQSPRIITIAKPSTECTMQDLYDTLRWLEFQTSAMDDSSIVDASGKEPLGGGTKVGITVTLQNAQVSFEARDGTEFGGIDEWTLTQLNGGNLVAVNGIGEIIVPIHNTTFVNVGLTSSSSATLQEQDALQYSSYNSVVSVDVTSSTTGTEYPSGNMEFPVNNIQDAVLIGQEKGFDTIFVRGSITLDTGDDIQGFTLVGQNVTRSRLVVLDGANTLDCEFRNFHIEGILDGGSTIKQCEIHVLNYVNGYVYSSVLTESLITLGGNDDALFLDCWSGVAGANTPTIDMGGSGQSLVLRGYEGGLKIINRTGTDAVSIDFNSGQFIADSTITNGLIYVRGTVGKVTIDCDPQYIDTTGVMNQQTIPKAVWEYELP